MGAISGLASPPNTGLLTPSIDNITIAVVNTEQSYVFPNFTKNFKIQNVGNYILKMSYTATESGTKYFTIYPGSFLEVFSISALSVTIYLQSPGLIPIQLEIWQ